MIKKGQYLSVHVFSSNDNSYTIRTETGFSCHAFSTMHGFHADKNGNQGFGRSWREVTNFRINMVLNRGADLNNGFHGIRGNKGSTNYGTISVAGSVYLQTGNRISTYLYSSSDNSFIVQSESGFGCHQMGTRIGFHADASGDQVFGRGWARLARWRTSGNNELYALGG